jgi:hypothetical protein
VFQSIVNKSQCKTFGRLLEPLGVHNTLTLIIRNFPSRLPYNIKHFQSCTKWFNVLGRLCYSWHKLTILKESCHIEGLWEVPIPSWVGWMLPFIKLSCLLISKCRFYLEVEGKRFLMKDNEISTIRFYLHVPWMFSSSEVCQLLYFCN